MLKSSVAERSAHAFALQQHNSINARPIGSALFNPLLGLVVTTSRQLLSGRCPSRTDRCCRPIPWCDAL